MPERRPIDSPLSSKSDEVKSSLLNSSAGFLDSFLVNMAKHEALFELRSAP